MLLKSNFEFDRVTGYLSLLARVKSRSKHGTKVLLERVQLVLRVHGHRWTRARVKFRHRVTRMCPGEQDL
jgi:hypothetical protein